MLENTEYLITITGEPFLYHETKKVVNLKLTGMTDDLIRQKVMDENLFQYKAASSLIRIYRAIIRRVNCLDSYLIDKIAYGDIDTSKLVILYSIMKTDRLFFDFMNEVFKEKLILHDMEIADKDFNIFIMHKREQSEKIASLQESTVYKIKQVCFKILSEAGLIKSTRDRTIIKPFIELDLKSYLESIGDSMYVKTLLGAV